MIREEYDDDVKGWELTANRKLKHTQTDAFDPSIERNLLQTSNEKMEMPLTL